MSIAKAPESSPISEISSGRALVAGLIGSFAKTFPVRLAQAAPIPLGTGGFAKFTLATINLGLSTLGLIWREPPNFRPVGQEGFHTAVGVTMSPAYAVVRYARLHRYGPRW